MRNKNSRGFTLVELMVGISIVALLSSVAMYSTAQARAKADDAKKKAEVGQVRVALALHKETTGRVPYNYSCSGTFCSPSGGVSLGDSVATEGSPAYVASMQELVTAGYLSAVPKSKDGSYVYYADETAQRAAFGAPLATGTAQPTQNKCAAIPAAMPYNSCMVTYYPPDPYYSGPDVVNFYVPNTTTFCNTYGNPACNAGGNGQYANACPNGPWCIVPAVDPIISCTVNTSAVSVCTGAGNDFCTCTE